MAALTFQNLHPLSAMESLRGRFISFQDGFAVEFEGFAMVFSMSVNMFWAGAWFSSTWGAGPGCTCVCVAFLCTWWELIDRSRGGSVWLGMQAAGGRGPERGPSCSPGMTPT